MITKDEARRIALHHAAGRLANELAYKNYDYDGRYTDEELDKIAAAALKLANELLRRANADFAYR